MIDDTRSQLYGRYRSTHVEPLYGRSRTGGSTELIYNANLRAHLPERSDARIVDLGCGAGDFLAYLQRLGYEDVRGVDISREQVEEAHRAGVSSVEQGDLAGYLRGRRDSFDAVSALDVLEHLRRDELLEVLRSARTALRQDGRMIVQTVNGASPMSGAIRYGDLTHETAYTRSSLAQGFREAGFTRVDVFEVVIPVHGIASGLRRVLWPLVRFPLVALSAVETGQVRGHILTRNLIAVAYR